MAEDQEEEIDIYDDAVQEGMWYELMASDEHETPPPPESMAEDGGGSE